jgi:putative DNA methylase
VMLEDIPRHGPELAEELRRVGAEIKTAVEQDLADLYPKDPDGATPIAYLWSRTVHCESPNCGAEIPLMRLFWLCRRASRRRALKPIVTRRGMGGEPPHVSLEIFEPRSEDYVQRGAVNKAKATCLACNTTMSATRVRTQLAAERGGANVRFDNSAGRIGGCRLVAVVRDTVGGQRDYREPSKGDYIAVQQARRRVAEITCTHGEVIAEALPGPEGRTEDTAEAYFNFLPCQIYGLESWSDLFADRQKVALMATISACRKLSSPRTQLLFGAVLGRCTDYWSAGAMWAQEGEFVAHTFGRHALPVILDFAETNPIGCASGSLNSAIDWVLRVVNAWVSAPTVRQVQCADARDCPLPDESTAVWFTDPPYYDAVPYSYLSNFFLVWLKRLLFEEFEQGRLGELENGLAPSSAEMIDTLALLRGTDRKSAISRGLRLKDKAYFENAMQEAFSEGNRVLRMDGIGCVVFAHKTTEGWEALLSGMVRSGWTVTASWPLATERPGRLRSQNSSALATSVHLICRPRSDDAPTGDWAAVIRELPNRVSDWMERLQGEGVRGADLVFACIGPALEIFSRYAKVETAEGHEVPLAEYLEKVWEVVGRSALAQVLGTTEAKARNGAAGAVEEDARLTALFLWTFQSTNGEDVTPASSRHGDEIEGAEDEEQEQENAGKMPALRGYTLVFDVVRRFAQPLGIELPKWEGRIIETKKGVVRLLPSAERAKQLFGEDGAQAMAARLEREATTGQIVQLELFSNIEQGAAPAIRGRGRGRRASVHVSEESHQAARQATTLDRVHAAMLLQAGGRTNALRALLKAEQDRGPDFLRLANALSALYPKGSEEKRLLDAMLLAIPR